MSLSNGERLGLIAGILLLLLLLIFNVLSKSCTHEEVTKEMIEQSLQDDSLNSKVDSHYPTLDSVVIDRKKAVKKPQKLKKKSKTTEELPQIGN
ncbi:MAG: hypothetical protein PHR45_02765 [Muribaculaceae bacterium]|nr:hypothetical protein [Muribaculaceae bacterium]